MTVTQFIKSNCLRDTHQSFDADAGVDVLGL